MKLCSSQIFYLKSFKVSNNFFKKEKESLPSARSRALSKEILKKNLCRVPDLGHSAKT